MSRESSSSPLGWGFGVTCGVIAALLVLCGGGTLLCAGLGGFGMVGIGKVHERAEQIAGEATAREAAGHTARPPAPSTSRE